jgi:asparagine synthetase B (glutamine-hydrolysing)
MATRIMPSGLHQEKHLHVSPGSNLLVAVLGRREQVTTHGQNILAGIILDDSEQFPWWQLDGPVPDGSFALFRGDDNSLEAITDFAGSKTIWHARLMCGGVVASTSMELIIALLGDFAVDDESLGWFLSSGSSGPRRSWDRRIKPLAPNSRLRARLDGATVSVREIPLERPDERSDEVDFAGLKVELTETVSSLQFGSKPWLLALSGGHDSRAILHATRHVDDLTCVTWVDEFLTDRADSDLAIARQLARETG